MNQAPVQPGDLLADKYRVERVLGVGGMGVVVEATHIQLEERVALKFMLPEAMANPEVVARFLREARLAVKLKSEHVAKVMDVGTLTGGAPYIVMEFLEGTDLDHLLQRHGPLPFADVAEYVIQACDGIAEAHAQGIVHRDLKPANLFLTRRPDGTPLVKVLDFGISKANALSQADGGVTKTAMIMGSPNFMSPEQMRSAKDVDSRSDVWSIGVILFELLTTRLPFESDSLGGIMAKVLTETPAALSTYRPDVPHAFDQIVRRCLVREREGRAQSVGDIVMALAQYAPPRTKPIADRVVSTLSVGAGSGATMASAGAPRGAPAGGEETRASVPATSVMGAGPLAGTSTSVAGVPKKSSAGTLAAVVVVLGVLAAGGWYAMTRAAASNASAAPDAPTAPTAPVAPSAPSATARAATAEPTVTPVATVAPAAPPTSAVPPAEERPATDAPSAPHGGPARPRKRPDAPAAPQKPRNGSSVLDGRY